MRYIILSVLFLSACASQVNTCDCSRFVLAAKYTFDNYEICQICADLFNDKLHTAIRQEMLADKAPLHHFP